MKIQITGVRLKLKRKVHLIYHTNMSQNKVREAILNLRKCEFQNQESYQG